LIGLCKLYIDMPIKITFIFVLVTILSVSAQDQIPDEQELFGEWSLAINDFRSGNKKYILYSRRNDLTRNDLPMGAKIIISEEGITKRYILRGSICGNDHRFIHNRVYGKHKTPMVYNKSEGILEISSNNVFGYTMLSVRKLDSGNVLLTKVE